jgi:hypothetical protein
MKSISSARTAVCVLLLQQLHFCAASWLVSPLLLLMVKLIWSLSAQKSAWLPLIDGGFIATFSAAGRVGVPVP